MADTERTERRLRLDRVRHKVRKTQLNAAGGLAEGPTAARPRRATLSDLSRPEGSLPRSPIFRQDMVG